MLERQDDTALIDFQWTVGDTRAFERNVQELIKPQHSYAITVLARLVAFLLTLAVATAILPSAGFMVLLAVTVVASLSIWVSLGLEIGALRFYERLQADHPSRVGWNSVQFDASGITWSTETGFEYTSWLGVIDVVERDGSMWFKTGPVHGHYIPPRVFSSKAELAEFRTFIRNLRNNPLSPAHLPDVHENLVKH